MPGELLPSQFMPSKSDCAAIIDAETASICPCSQALAVGSLVLACWLSSDCSCPWSNAIKISVAAQRLSSSVAPPLTPYAEGPAANPECSIANGP